jgi:hypothetical protein
MNLTDKAFVANSFATDGFKIRKIQQPLLSHSVRFEFDVNPSNDNDATFAFIFINNFFQIAVSVNLYSRHAALGLRLRNV